MYNIIGMYNRYILCTHIIYRNYGVTYGTIPDLDQKAEEMDFICKSVL